MIGVAVLLSSPFDAVYSLYKSNLLDNRSLKCIHLRCSDPTSGIGSSSASVAVVLNLVVDDALEDDRAVGIL